MYKMACPVQRSEQAKKEFADFVVQIELVVDSSASVACHRYVGGFARDGLVRTVRYADRWRSWMYHPRGCT